MSLLLGLYIVASVILALGFISSGEVLGFVMGVAIMVFPVLGVWSLVRELRFGYATDRALAELASEGWTPETILGDSGRPDRAASLARAEEFQTLVAARPEDWRAWIKLSIARDGAGQRPLARAAARTAIQLRAAQIRLSGR